MPQGGSIRVYSDTFFTAFDESGSTSDKRVGLHDPYLKCATKGKVFPSQAMKAYGGVEV
jgi:hypothetical protein